jgi:wyosine [tRNA(Phe)-imidazoG37] synthetase (radical SAM superfamily)
MSIAESATTVYGPVRSWRAGLSLGVDLLCVNSICSFRCLYCQLGKINVHTRERKIYVPTERVITDLLRSSWHVSDIITLSGSGEPTLAANMGEVIRQIKAVTGKPVLVLTNATMLSDETVRRELCEADKISCKLDAMDEETFRGINRPLEGLTLRAVIEGIKMLRREFTGELAIQTMLMPMNVSRMESFAQTLKELEPDEVQLNLPSRPIPHKKWLIDARGNNNTLPVRAAHLKTVEPEQAEEIENMLRRLTGLKISSPHRALSN